MVPKVLSYEQKERRKELCLDLLQCAENEPDLLNSVFTCNETWIFTYDLETKRQSMQRKSTSSPRPKKKQARVVQVQGHVVFFDIQGIVVAESLKS
jgi:hypothetical protein